MVIVNDRKLRWGRWEVVFQEFLDERAFVRCPKNGNDFAYLSWVSLQIGVMDLDYGWGEDIRRLQRW